MERGIRKRGGDATESQTAKGRLSFSNKSEGEMVTTKKGTIAEPAKKGKKKRT